MTITERELAAFRPRESPRMKWEDDVKQYLKVTKMYNWKKKAKK
jgi:hypothetical protein